MFLIFFKFSHFFFVFFSRRTFTWLTSLHPLASQKIIINKCMETKTRFISSTPTFVMFDQGNLHLIYLTSAVISDAWCFPLKMASKSIKNSIPALSCDLCIEVEISLYCSPLFGHLFPPCHGFSQ